MCRVILIDIPVYAYKGFGYIVQPYLLFNKPIGVFLTLLLQILVYCNCSGYVYTLHLCLVAIKYTVMHKYVSLVAYYGGEMLY